MAIPFWERCTKGLKGVRFFALIPVCSGYSRDSLKIEERLIAVHVWMMGVGFIVLFMTPFFIAMQTGNEPSDE